jgi:hypothetical protein
VPLLLELLLVLELPPLEPVQHWMLAAPGQYPAVAVPRHALLSMHVPAEPLTLHALTQHWMFAAPGQYPG